MPTTPSQIANPTRKPSVTTLLDITRANNIAIMLSRFKITPLEIRQALLSLDDKMSIDDLKAISKQLPSPEEIARIKDFEDISKLAKADQYLSAIMTIPRLPQRLDCMIYRQKLELEIEEIRPDLKIVHDACKELRASPRFKATLQAVLTVGNALNGSSFRGGARGFRLEALMKMKETRTAKGSPECPTLLHYVARVLIRTDPSLTLFIDEMPSVESAARVSFPTLQQNVQSLVTSLDKVKEETSMLRQIRMPSDNDQFVAVMQPFAFTVAKSVDALKNMASVVETDLRALFSYYGENLDSPEGPKPDDFFGMVCSFSSSLQKAALETHDANKKAPGFSQRKISSSSRISPEETVKEQHDPSHNLLAPPDGMHERSTSIGRGDLDEAIRTLREGRTRRSRAPRSITRASKIFLDGRPDLS
ncbi:hypothetical protein AZE42_11865 [Rhizopogon vesiculosus]|uniref:FH2 domain-containing protein n=1 Tax=Rhizopogon vesiculosus TaxID=180088 RepID=A0A1J8QWD2_9AGAM|nr:hypothetical protein AZE42_11865 [Rhizopogon vesiculosus]